MHVTLRVVRGMPSMRGEAVERVVKQALSAQREAAKAKASISFQVVHFTIETDHLHLIVEADDRRALARGIAGLEIRVARRLNALLGRKGGVWSGRYHRHDLRTPAETRNALRYVRGRAWGAGGDRAQGRAGPQPLAAALPTATARRARSGAAERSPPGIITRAGRQRGP